MTWWGWIIAGAILLGAELSFVNAQFYLVFIGGAAMIVGLIAALTSLPHWAQWALFALLALIFMVGFRSRIYRQFRRELPRVRTGPVGGSITLHAALAPGASSQVEHGGTYWTVHNAGSTTIPEGGRARIDSVRDLTLFVTPEP